MVCNDVVPSEPTSHGAENHEVLIACLFVRCVGCVCIGFMQVFCSFSSSFSCSRPVPRSHLHDDRSEVLIQCFDDGYVRLIVLLDNELIIDAGTLYIYGFSENVEMCRLKTEETPFENKPLRII